MITCICFQTVLECSNLCKSLKGEIFALSQSEGCKIFAQFSLVEISYVASLEKLYVKKSCPPISPCKIHKTFLFECDQVFSTVTNGGSLYLNSHFNVFVVASPLRHKPPAAESYCKDLPGGNFGLISPNTRTIHDSLIEFGNKIPEISDYQIINVKIYYLSFDWNKRLFISGTVIDLKRIGSKEGKFGNGILLSQSEIRNESFFGDIHGIKIYILYLVHLHWNTIQQKLKYQKTHYVNFGPSGIQVSKQKRLSEWID